MKKYFDLRGKTAIVTGCSTGLGVQMAKALANQGANIVALARRQDKIEAVAKEIKEQFEVETLAVKCDITDTEAVKAAVKKVLDHFGKIDILINNAGTGAVAPAEDITDDQFSNEVNVDLFGTFKVAREVAKQAMIPQNHAAKGGVVNLTRALAAEWGKHGITVNAICPGYFYTPLTRETLDTPSFKQYADSVIPAERYGEEGELDAAAIFLASDNSAYVNGIMLPVDGGYTCV